ncbi:MAG: HNH endonuclease [Mycobacteriaceae bacterium]
MSAPGLNSHSRSKLLAKWKRQGKTCAYCSRLADTIDHVVPLVRGGTNYEGNLVPCCRKCNGGKAALLIVEWRTGKRLPPMTSALAWERKQQRKVRPLVAVQVEIKVCPVCATLHERPVYCSDACCTEYFALKVRNDYRRKVGLPEDWRRVKRHAPKQSEFSSAA